MQTIDILTRDPKTEGNEALRDAGMTPAVVYGPKQEALSIKVEASQFEKIYRTAGESTVVGLKQGNDIMDVLIHTIDRHPVTEKIRHIDFYAIERGKKLTLSVPLTFTGESEAEKAGHVLVTVLYEVEVEVLPRNIPHEITVDISSLTEVGSQILAQDIVMPEGVELVNDPESPVALIQAVKEEVEEETEASIDDIEVEGEKKDDEEGEGETSE